MKKIRKITLTGEFRRKRFLFFILKVILNVTLTGKVGMQPILPNTVPIKKIKGVTHQQYGDSRGVLRCEQTLTISP